MAKVISLNEAAALVKDGDTVLAGGFLNVGGAIEVAHALAQTDVKHLTLAANDGGAPARFEHGIQELIHNGQVDHLIATHIGMNKEVGEKMNDGSMKVTLVPQGSLAEKIRCGGFGLGAALTPTGLGTPVGVGSEDAAGGIKESIVIDGKEYLVEKALRGNVALIYASVADKYGNVKIHGDARNFNIVMATAADTVICEAQKVVDLLDPDEILIPGVLVDYIVDMGGNK